MNIWETLYDLQEDTDLFTAAVFIWWIHLQISYFIVKVRWTDRIFTTIQIVPRRRDILKTPLLVRNFFTNHIIFGLSSLANRVLISETSAFKGDIAC